MSRGNGGRDIFIDDDDRRRFLDILSKVKKATPFELFAYCLMSNHFHMLVRVGGFDLSRIMQHLLTRYSRYFNGRRRRLGHLFQSRFKAPLCDGDSYLIELLRYIHLNPVRAKMVSDPAQWPWSSHRCYLGAAAAGLVDPAFPLSLFDGSETEARRRYLDFLQADGDAGQAATGTPAAAKPEKKGDPANPIDRDRIEEALLRLAQDICAEHHVPIEDLRGATRRRDASRARRALIRRCEERGLRPGAIAAFIRRSPAAISKVINLRP